MKNFKLVFRFVSLFAFSFLFTSCIPRLSFVIPVGNVFHSEEFNKIQNDKELSYFYTNNDEFGVSSIFTNFVLDNNKRLIVVDDGGKYLFYEFNITSKVLQKKYTLELKSDAKDRLMNIFIKNGNLELYISKNFDDNLYLLKTVLNLNDFKLLKDELIFTTNTQKEIDLDDVFELENSTKTYSNAAHYKFAEKFYDEDYRKFFTKLIFDKDNNLVLIPIITIYKGEEISYIFRQYFPKENKFIDFSQYLCKVKNSLPFDLSPLIDENNSVIYGCYSDTNKIKKQNVFVSTNGETKSYTFDLPKELSEDKNIDKFTVNVNELPKRTIIQKTSENLYLISVYVKDKRTNVYGKDQSITGINIKKFDKNTMKIILENNIEFNKDLAEKNKFEDGIKVNYLSSVIDKEGNLLLLLDNTYKTVNTSSHTSYRGRNDMFGTTTTSSNTIYGFGTIWLFKFDSKLSLNWLKKVVERDGVDYNPYDLSIEYFDGISRENFANCSLNGNNLAIRYLNKGKEIPAGIYEKTFSTDDGKEISSSTFYAVPK